MVRFSYKIENFDFIIDIKYLKNTEEIFIQCKTLDNCIYSSFYNLQNLRDMDIIFTGSKSSSDAFSLLCNYFKENKLNISLMSNSTLIIEIYKDVKPDWKFILLRKGQNNNSEEEILIGGNSNNINNSKNNILEGLESNLNEQELNLSVAHPKINQMEEVKANLNYILIFLLLKEIAYQIVRFDQFEEYNLKEIKWILEDIKKNKDSIENQNPKSEINILNYINYLKFLFDNNILELFPLIIQLLEIVEQDHKKNEIKNYWKYLSKYEEHNNEFDFLNDLKNCHFDYSIISMDIVERDNLEEYEQKKKECKNMKKMILYHEFEIEPNSNEFNMKLNYTYKSNYGEGFYFSNSIDYISSLKYNGNIPNIDETFSLMACEIFYDEEKLKIFEDKESNQNDILNHKVEPNGLIKIENYYFYDYNNEICIKDNGKGIIHNVYILSKNYQILPLYIFTLKRNEYFVLYRDPNFLGDNQFSHFLQGIQKKSYQLMKNMNIYFEGCTEEALKFLLKRKNQKVILITSIGLASGKRFVEVARKIYGFNLLVLFFSSEKSKKLNSEWIKEFPNCLFTTKPNLYIDYITKYNEIDLKVLREKDEEINNINLKEFSFNFIDFINCHSDIKYNSLKYINNFPYFRKVYILCPNKNLYLGMTKKGKVEKSEQTCSWYITSFEYKITFFSNRFYLDIDNGMPFGSKYMNKWDYENISEDCYYYIINTKNNKEKKYLSMEDEGIFANKKEPDDNTKFKFIDILE